MSWLGTAPLRGSLPLLTNKTRPQDIKDALGLDENGPDIVQRGNVFVRAHPKGEKLPRKKGVPCSGCAKRREAIKAAAKAYAESKPFTVAERIAAAVAACKEKLKRGS